MSADTKEKTGMREMFLRTVAVIGLLAVLILGAWGIIVLATSIPHLFERTGQEIGDALDTSDEPQTSVVVTNSKPVPTTPVKPAAVTKPAAPAYTSTPGATYVAAPTRAALYGSPDLYVNVANVYPAGSDRTTVQFTVFNAGTNIAPSGWAFEAEFPWERSTYTYASPSQQTLYPGDKIVYTLGLDTSNSRYNYDDECDTNGYRSWDERDWENWYDDEDCADDFDCPNIDDNDWEDWDDNDWQDWYEDDCDEDEYYDNRNDDRDYNTNGTITITVDPQNRVYESNERNNEVSVRQ